MAAPRVLLTGKSGFTGRYVAEELERRGYEVIGLSNHPQPDDPASVQVDLLDAKAVAAAVTHIKPSVVVHLAAIPFVAHGNVGEMYRVNLGGTRHLLDALASASIRPDLVVLASSANVYGNATVDPITEDVRPAPANDYAVSKLAMEYMARLWMDKLPIVITRPFNYTGVGQSELFLISKIVAHFRRGEKRIELGNTAVMRDFGDVRDVAAAYGALVERKPIGSVLNICTGRANSLRDVIEDMEAIAGYSIKVEVNPNFVRTNEIYRLTGSPGRIEGEIGWRPKRSLQETLAWMFSAEVPA